MLAASVVLRPVGGLEVLDNIANLRTPRNLHPSLARPTSSGMFRCDVRRLSVGRDNAFSTLANGSRWL